MNSDYHHHKFKDNFNETAKTNGKDPQSEKLSFYIKRSFLYVILNKLLLSLSFDFSHPLYIKDSLHYIDLF